MKMRKDAFGCRDPRVILQLMSTGTLRSSAHEHVVHEQHEGACASTPLAGAR